MPTAHHSLTLRRRYLCLIAATAAAISSRHHPAAAVATTAPSAQLQQAQCTAQQLEVILANLLSIKSLEADFTQHNHDGSEASGELLVQAPDRMRLEYMTPRHLLIISNSGKVTMHDFALAESTFIDDPLKIGSIIGNKKLRQKFTIDCLLIPSSDRRSPYQAASLTFKLKNPPKTIGIGAEPPHGLLLKLHEERIIELQTITASGQTIGRLSLGNVRLNRSINPTQFIFSDPKLHELD